MTAVRYIVIDDARVSWHHAVLHAEAGHWTIEDEDSKNGTYADRCRVRTRGVGPGSVIRFGNPASGPRRSCRP
ncbi:FHA domain-containing protein [Actinacidiphila oryziradicis]|uniref:FHA domain-containing protein n=1 Tax=Actinacidiphila oryziradicis TaxID=2571141 RepID=A0A4U0RFS7_9ACTN|nr:FHA domain-containing protein [Actinacidiphila oryziradicis]